MLDDLEREKAVSKIDEALTNLPKDDAIEVYKILASKAADAAMVLGSLVWSGETDNVKLAAARDILDRTGYKPIERKDVTSAGQAITMPALTDEALMSAINGFLKRTAIDVPGREVESVEGNISPGP